jgi:predicted transcriptional regulator
MLQLSLDDPKRLCAVCNGLSSELRINILNLLEKRSMNVVEIAEKLNIAVSTAAFNINILKEAELITTQFDSGKRGTKKICSKNYDDIHIELNHSLKSETQYGFYKVEMPLGHFSDCMIYPTCGMAGETSMIAPEDEPGEFFIPERVNAELIWFRKGYIEYKFSKGELNNKNTLVDNIQFSMEICSEAPNYNNDWPSDITLWVNDIEVATWTSPGDFGGIRGKLNPDWWWDYATQYGILKTWDITNMGTFEDGRLVSDIKLGDIKLENSRFIKLRIGIKEDAANPGGVNLFGRKFGNYEQSIVMKVKYSIK